MGYNGKILNQILGALDNPGRDRTPKNKQKKKAVVSPRGQWDYPGQNTIVPTPTGRITMQGVPYPVYGQDETGYGQMMMPGGEYQFPGQMVYEQPMLPKAQFGIPSFPASVPLTTMASKLYNKFTTPSLAPKSAQTVMKEAEPQDNLNQLYDMQREAINKFDSRFDVNDRLPSDSSQMINLSSGRFRGAKVTGSLIKDIVASAKQQGVDPWLLLSVVGRESTYGSGTEANKERAGSKRDLVSGWNVAEDYRGYNPVRFLADRQVPGVKTFKDYHGWDYDVEDEDAVQNYLAKNPRILEQYKKKLSSLPDVGDMDAFDLAARRIKKKGLRNYNPGDPAYEKMVNDDMKLLKSDKEMVAMMKSLGYEYGGEMIRRADGSYSKRGLWDNIRANKGSGKKPTKEMLKQERKIKEEDMKRNMAFGGYLPEMFFGGKMKKNLEEAAPMLLKFAPMLFGAPPIMQKGGEPDGSMALGQIDAAIDKLNTLRKFIQPESDLEPWVSSKLTLMDHYTDAVSDYMQYNPEAQEDMQEPQGLPMPEMKNGGGIPERYKNMGFTKVGVKKESTRPGKKWMVLAQKGNQYKVVHGGYDGMKDYTQHGSEKRRDRFWDRMGGKNSAKAQDPFSPLYWHKRFGTWADGGEISEYQDGGDYVPVGVPTPQIPISREYVQGIADRYNQHYSKVRNIQSPMRPAFSKDDGYDSFWYDEYLPSLKPNIRSASGYLVKDAKDPNEKRFVETEKKYPPNLGKNKDNRFSTEWVENYEIQERPSAGLERDIVNALADKSRQMSPFLRGNYRNGGNTPQMKKGGSTWSGNAWYQEGGEPRMEDYPDFGSWKSAYDSYMMNNTSMPEVAEMMTSGMMPMPQQGIERDIPGGGQQPLPPELRTQQGVPVPIAPQIISAAVAAPVTSSSASSPSAPSISYQGASIVDMLNSVGKPSDYNSRKQLAAELGITGYYGSAKQNMELMRKIQGNPSVLNDYKPAAAGRSRKSSGSTTVSRLKDGNIYTTTNSVGADGRPVTTEEISIDPYAALLASRAQGSDSASTQKSMTGQDKKAKADKRFFDQTADEYIANDPYFFADESDSDWVKLIDAPFAGIRNLGARVLLDRDPMAVGQLLLSGLLSRRPGAKTVKSGPATKALPSPTPVKALPAPRIPSTPRGPVPGPSGGGYVQPSARPDIRGFDMPERGLRSPGYPLFAKGGPVTGDVMDVTPEQLEMLRAQGYQFEMI